MIPDVHLQAGDDNRHRSQADCPVPRDFIGVKSLPMPATVNVYNSNGYNSQEQDINSNVYQT